MDDVAGGTDTAIKQTTDTKDRSSQNDLRDRLPFGKHSAGGTPELGPGVRRVQEGGAGRGGAQGGAGGRAGFAARAPTLSIAGGSAGAAKSLCRSRGAASRQPRSPASDFAAPADPPAIDNPLAFPHQSGQCHMQIHTTKAK